MLPIPETNLLFQFEQQNNNKKNLPLKCVVMEVNHAKAI